MIRVKPVNYKTVVAGKNPPTEQIKIRKSEKEELSLSFFPINKNCHSVGECFYFIFKQIPLDLSLI